MTKEIPLTLHDGTEVLVRRDDDEPDTLSPEDIQAFDDYMAKVKAKREGQDVPGFLPD